MGGRLEWCERHPAGHSVSSPLKRRLAVRRLIASRENRRSPGPCHHGTDPCGGTAEANENSQSRTLWELGGLPLMGKEGNWDFPSRVSLRPSPHGVCDLRC